MLQPLKDLTGGENFNWFQSLEIEEIDSPEEITSIGDPFAPVFSGIITLIS